MMHGTWFNRLCLLLVKLQVSRSHNSVKYSMCALQGKHSLLVLCQAFYGRKGYTLIQNRCQCGGKALHLILPGTMLLVACTHQVDLPALAGGICSTGTPMHGYIVTQQQCLSLLSSVTTISLRTASQVWLHLCHDKGSSESAHAQPGLRMGWTRHQGEQRGPLVHRDRIGHAGRCVNMCVCVRVCACVCVRICICVRGLVVNGRA